MANPGDFDGDRVVMTEFLERYREYRCLWDTSFEGYSDREVRHEALASLFQIFQIAHPRATLLTMRRKIDNMRTAYRREFKKVRYAYEIEMLCKYRLNCRVCCPRSANVHHSTQP